MKLIKYLGLALIAASVAWGCNENNTKLQPKQSQQEEREQSPQQEQVQTSPQLEAPVSDKLDSYGREPGHAHYGHDHPLQDLDQGDQIQQINPMMQGSPAQTQQAPASGEPDKYGRKPGAAHYGHDHALLDEELNN